MRVSAAGMRDCCFVAAMCSDNMRKCICKRYTQTCDVGTRKICIFVCFILTSRKSNKGCTRLTSYIMKQHPSSGPAGGKLSSMSWHATYVATLCAFCARSTVRTRARYATLLIAGFSQGKSSKSRRQSSFRNQPQTLCLATLVGCTIAQSTRQCGHADIDATSRC